MQRAGEIAQHRYGSQPAGECEHFSHRWSDGFVPHRAAGVQQHALARSVVNAEFSKIIDCIPLRPGPVIGAPVENPGQAQALAQKSRLNAEIGPCVIDQPLGRIIVLRKRVV